MNNEISHREAFIRTKRYFGIQGSKLSRHTGIDQNRISEFINLKKDGSGEYKRDLASSVLDTLVQGMEELEPGAKLFYIQELAGKGIKLACDPKILVRSMNDEEVSDLMFAIAEKMGSKEKDSQGMIGNEKQEQLAVSH